MSWDRFERKEVASCQCGNGNVLRVSYFEMDDWNRTRFGIESENILCPFCSAKFHIESYKGSSYLVPNGLSMPTLHPERVFWFCNIDERIVATFNHSDIVASISDMKASKYSTRLKENTSKEIVAMYYKQFRKRNLQSIVKLLEDIQARYLDFIWTPEKIKEYKEQEKNNIENIKNEINNVISQSFELEFRKHNNE